MQAYGKRCCSYFRWYDEDGYGRDNRCREQKIIAAMARKIQEKTKTEKDLKIALVICVFVIILLCFAYAIK